MLFLSLPYFITDVSDLWYRSCLYRMLFSNYGFCENWCSRSHILLKSTEEFFQLFSSFFIYIR
jgi:hypothetical protein